jgi:hypothetical protein
LQQPDCHSACPDGDASRTTTNGDRRANTGAADANQYAYDHTTHTDSAHTSAADACAAHSNPTSAHAHAMPEASHCLLHRQPD